MGDLLSNEQRAALLQKFQAQGGGPENGLSPEVQQAAVEAGAQQAQAQVEGQPADTGEPAAPEQPPQQPAVPAAPAQPQEDPNAAALASVGFKSVDELIQAFVQQGQETSAMKQQMNQLVGLQKAMENTEELDPQDPQYELRKIVRETIGPLADEMKAQARNRSVQGAWAEDAKSFPDIGDMDKDIAGYLAEHPDLAIDPTGLRQAYHAVRSSKFIPEGKQFDDPKAVERAASNPAVKAAVIKAYLSGIQRGEVVPSAVGGGGNIPLTGEKPKASTISEASNMLREKLGIPKKK